MMNRELNSFKEKNISGALQSDIKLFTEIFKKDAVFRKREISSNLTNACILFMDGMVNTEVINESIVKPLILAKNSEKTNDIANYIKNSIIFANEIKLTSNIAEMLSGILYGDTVLLVDKSKTALIINTKGWRTRGISEPNDERVLQGPREGFDEALMLNLAMLRRKLPTPDLCVEYLSVGRKTDTKIFICYIDSVVKKRTVEIIKKRIKKIDIDGVLDSNYINELINDNKNSWFKTIGSTERPDVVAARLLEGRVALMVDGTPVVLTIPYLFVENFQSDDDYYLNFWFAAIGRILRYICFFIAVFAPALYVAITIYNP
ncbi:MAG: spore germination protein, partial [Clostridia bacterium]|nr:spore germination protein [Clostridia bacterium]